MRLWAVLMALMVVAGQVCAQGTTSDYERADGLNKRFRAKVYGDTVRAHWLEGGDRLWYRVARRDGSTYFYLVDAKDSTKRELFDHAKLIKDFAKHTGKPVDVKSLPMDFLVVEGDDRIRFAGRGKGWRYDPKTGALEEGPKPDKPKKPARRKPGLTRGPSFAKRGKQSPDKKWLAYIENHNLHVKPAEGGEGFKLSADGSDKNVYDASVYWSPDSKKLVSIQTRPGDQRKVYLIESAPKDRLQPKLHSYNYLKPGDKIALRRPRLFDLGKKSEIPVDNTLFDNPWSLGEYRWAKDSSHFTFYYNQRGHQVERVLSIDAASGAVRTVIEEKAETFVDYAYKHFAYYLDSTDQIIWMSERSGWNHLYLFDAKTGKVKHPITKGDWLVRAVDRVDAKAKQIWFRAMGLDKDQDPYHVHHCRVNFDGTGFTRLTDGDGKHELIFSPDQRYYFDSHSRVDSPPVTELRRASDGEKILTLEEADTQALMDAGWQRPERFKAKGRDGATDIWGVIFRPTNFDPKKRYPVIEKIYAGPHGHFVPKVFRPYHSAQAMAELGFVVVQIDGMGTNWRSRAFHDVCWKNLGDSGFPDRIAWMRAAAKDRPWMDLSRVGIFGGSAGGQSATRALLAHGDFYKVAVSDCGCHDNRMDKIWWNEAWMGWPIGPHYAEQSNVTQAHRLSGKLLLFVGELDRNVDPASTMQVVDALIKADKDFDLIVMTCKGHGSAETPYGKRRRRDYFVRHLLGAEPRSAP